MENLVAICGVAFLVVFGLLLLLAVLMVAITTLFPQGEIQAQPRKSSASNSDPAVIAAVTAAVSALVPGAHVVHMEEDR